MKPTADLELVRSQINNVIEESKDLPKFCDWCFVDCNKYSIKKFGHKFAHQTVFQHVLPKGFSG